ncbi:chymotrypsin-2-like [Harmonia axyridis]|uniref:chymotrypsin-2-like n=1 Tax=Harmonia axyridis TaxID=115357 RepID=UPI001E275088|nr:chymotrypsin-2-like [Harmonia axyridis]
MKSLVLFFIIAGSFYGGFCSDRVVGGSDAPEGAFPYQVALQIRNSLFCGGSIIDNSWILTAAHCLDGQSAEKIKVVAGTTTLKNGTGQEFEVESLKIHENYNSKNVTNDIGLIKLKKAIEFNDKMKNVPLAAKETKGGRRLILTGWGKTRYPGQTTTKLQKIDLLSVSDSDCATVYSGRVDKRNICTFGIPGRGACQGDSGGPLVLDGTQVGVVSWGVACARGLPDVFTDVYNFRDWIEQNIKS